MLIKEDKEALLKITPTIAELRRIRALRDYTNIRRKYFGKSIPDVSCVSVIFVKGNVVGEIYGVAEPLGCNWNYQHIGIAMIAITEDCTDAVYLMTMLHEMAHLKIDKKFGRSMNHGKYWQAEMKRLARIGAFAPLW